MPAPKDRAALKPMAVGKWTYQKGGGMLCRLPLKRLRVSAPSDFLRAVESSCDGQASWEEVRQKLISRWTAGDVDACLSTLLDQGVLVDAADVLALQAQIGWTPQSLAPSLQDSHALHALRRCAEQQLTAPRTGARMLSPSTTTFVESLLRRSSARTFDDRDLSLQSMVNILWSMYGVLREGDERIHRTVPSGGALYGLRWFMALLRPMDGYPRGLYAINYHVTDREGGALSLTGCAGDADGAWSTLLTPSILSFAHAVIYPIADLRYIGKKYGNRSLTLAMLEAGHALQNGALAAQCEAATTIVRGDAVEVEILSLFGLEETLYPLPAMVLGAQSLPGQDALATAAQSTALVRTVPIHSQRLRLSTRAVVAGPIQIAGRMPEPPIWATGRSTDPRTAAIKAEAEAWERIGWLMPTLDLQRARMGELPNPLDPRLLVEYGQAQYQENSFPFSPFSPRRRYPWVPGVRVSDGAEVQVMAQCVYALSSLDASDRVRPFTNASTSGVAAFTDLATARARALVELIERDAFARTWLRRAPPPLIEETQLSHDARVGLRRLRDAGHAVSVHALPSRHLPVVAIFAQHEANGFTSITTAAGMHWEEAIVSALSETESRVQQRYGKTPKVAMPIEKVVLASDHGEFFASRANFRSANWFASSTIQFSSMDGGTFPSDMSSLLSHFMDAGLDVHFCNLTPSSAALNQGRTKLHVVRAFVPGLIPIWFGYGLAPMGLWARHGAAQGAAESLACSHSVHPCT